MKNITISELDYHQLLFTIQQLKNQLSKFKPKKSLKKKPQSSIAQRLHGILAIPSSFDEKQILEDELLKKYLVNE